MTLNRREFLLAAGGAMALSAFPAIAGARPKVVIVGVGYGGATCARYLKLWDPKVEVTVIEPNDRLVSCPMSNTVLAGWSRLGDITFPYDHLRKAVDRFVKDSVTAIDPDKRVVTTAGGHVFAYDRLILSPGVELQFDKVAGYDAEVRKTIKRVLRKTLGSLLPRRREPSQIKQLDTRLRGYDGFFEVPKSQRGQLRFVS